MNREEMLNSLRHQVETQRRKLDSQTNSGGAGVEKNYSELYARYRNLYNENPENGVLL